MKKLVIMLVVVAFAGTAFAEDVKQFKKGVTFNHKAHQQRVSGNCKKCHKKSPGKIAEFGEDWSHKTCKGCHTEMKKGPTACKDCHKQ